MYLPRDYNTGEPRGFGFVQFPDRRDGIDAMKEMDGRQFDGRDITVIEAQARILAPTPAL